MAAELVALCHLGAAVGRVKENAMQREAFLTHLVYAWQLPILAQADRIKAERRKVSWSPGALWGYGVKREIDGNPSVGCQTPFSSCQGGLKMRCNKIRVGLNPMLLRDRERKPIKLTWTARDRNR